MVDGLKKCYSTLREKGVNVGAVFPEYYDLTTGQSFNFQAYTPGNFFYKSVPGSQAIPWLEIITAISSGSLIPCNVLKTVGAMREDFFIDDVDTEWCHRARSCGFKLFGTSRARLTHRLGDESFRVWYFGWRAHNKYSGLRLYYRFRNFVLMCCLPHVPLRWSIRAGWYWLGNLYAYCFFAPDRWANAKAIAMGLWDGLRGRSGPYHGKSLDNRGLNILMQDRKPVAKKQ
jgi:rhamnosyltransferase